MPKRIVPKHRGFTVLEITVAVAIIAILSALLVYGISHLTASAKANSTGISLQNARNMVQEFDNATQLQRDTGHWPWLFFNDPSYPATPQVIFSGSTAAIGIPATIPSPPPPQPGLGLSYWTSPWRYLAPKTVGSVLTSDAASAPMFAPMKSFSTTATATYNSTDPAILLRNTSPAVLYTQLGMKMMGSLTACRTMLAGIPSSGTMVPEWNMACTWYATGNTVKVTNGPSVTYWRVLMDSAAGPPAEGASWTAIGVNPDPILLDAWGNPILLVPSGGIVNVWTNISNSNPIPIPPPPWGAAPTGGQIQAWVATQSQALQSYQQPPITAPDGKPFFVSAGPDGDFSAGDDNIYSFNK